MSHQNKKTPAALWAAVIAAMMAAGLPGKGWAQTKPAVDCRSMATTDAPLKGLIADYRSAPTAASKAQVEARARDLRCADYDFLAEGEEGSADKAETNVVDRKVHPYFGEAARLLRTMGLDQKSSAHILFKEENGAKFEGLSRVGVEAIAKDAKMNQKEYQKWYTDRLIKFEAFMIGLGCTKVRHPELSAKEGKLASAKDELTKIADAKSADAIMKKNEVTDLEREINALKAEMVFSCNPAITAKVTAFTAAVRGLMGAFNGTTLAKEEAAAYLLAADQNLQAKVARSELAVLNTSAALDIVQPPVEVKMETVEVVKTETVFQSAKFGGRAIWESDSGRPDWLPPVFVGVSGSYHGADLDGGKVASEGYSVLVWLSTQYAWKVSELIYVFAGVDLAVGHRSTELKHQDAKSSVTNAGVTGMGGAQFGVNFANWVSVYGFVRGIFNPGGVQGGGGTELTGLPVIRLALEGGGEYVANDSCAGLCGDKRTDYAGPFIQAIAKIAVW